MDKLRSLFYPREFSQETKILLLFDELVGYFKKDKIAQKIEQPIH